MPAPKLNDILPGLDPLGEHELCSVCGEAYGYPCCEIVDESVSCWNCMGDGQAEEYDPLWHESPFDVPPCRVCEGTGEITYQRCIGGCSTSKPHPKTNWRRA